MLRWLLLFIALLLQGCVVGPPITPEGANCVHYGIDEQQPGWSSPVCEVGEDGLPVVEIYTAKEMYQHCGNKGFWDRFAWGCVEDGKAKAVDDLTVQRHEQCHCIHGPRHSPWWEWWQTVKTREQRRAR